MRHEEFVDHELHSVQKWVRFISKGSEAHAFEYSEEKGKRVEVAVKSDVCETHIHATT